MKISNLLTRLRVWWQQRDDEELEHQVYSAIEDLSPAARLRIFTYVRGRCYDDVTGNGLVL